MTEKDAKLMIKTFAQMDVKLISLYKPGTLPTAVLLNFCRNDVSTCGVLNPIKENLVVNARSLIKKKY